MKKPLIVIFSILCAGQLLAQETNSKVIHQYSYINLSGGYVPEHGDLPAMAGYKLDGAFEYRNCQVWLKLESFVDTGDAAFGADMSRTSAGVGYVFRRDQNRINIIPRLGIDYLKITEDDLFGGETTLLERTAIEPCVTFSYALNCRFSLDAGYALDVDVDSGATPSQFNAGAVFAFARRWGLRLAGTIATDSNYNRLFAGIEFHF
jgi:hypothetical protein